VEALAISFIVALGLLLSGAQWKGIARWVLGALGFAVLIVSLSRLCEFYPNSCSLNCWIGQLAGTPCTSDSVQVVPSISPSVSPTLLPISPTTSSSVSPSVVSPSASQSVLPAQISPTVSPSTLPAPILPSVTPTTRPSLLPAPLPTQKPVLPSPSLSPCADGNCNCVDYKCLW